MMRNSLCAVDGPVGLGVEGAGAGGLTGAVGDGTGATGGGPDGTGFGTGFGAGAGGAAFGAGVPPPGGGASTRFTGDPTTSAKVVPIRVAISPNASAICTANWAVAPSGTNITAMTRRAGRAICLSGLISRFPHQRCLAALYLARTQLIETLSIELMPTRP